VHGAVFAKGGDAVLVATHGGLFEVTSTRVERVGQPHDLMGFAAGPGDDLLASGHPSGAGMPSPAGLMVSTDGGRTWTVRSRGGESDFHALSAAGAGAVGFDGQVRVSTDTRTWAEGSIDAEPFALAADGSGRTVMATTEKGLRRSTDGGRSFTAVAGAPLLLLVAHAGATRFVGATPRGELWVSDDGGTTWAQRAGEPGVPQALAARGDDVALVTDARVLVSKDGGATLQPLGR